MNRFIDRPYFQRPLFQFIYSLPCYFTISIFLFNANCIVFIFFVPITVEPTPANGSSTQLFYSVNAKTQRSTNSIGNWQGWSTFSGWFDFTFGIFHMALSQSCSIISQISLGFFPNGLTDTCPSLAFEMSFAWIFWGHSYIVKIKYIIICLTKP